MRIKPELLTTPLRFVFLCGTLGCATATATGNATQQTATIAIRESDVPFKRALGATSFEVTVVAKNEGPSPIYLSQCMWDAQRLIDNQWITVYRPICPATGSYFELAPGDSVVFPLSVSAYMTGAAATDPRLTPGEYRLGFGIGVGKSPVDHLRDPSVFVAVMSSTFFVTD